MDLLLPQTLPALDPIAWAAIGCVLLLLLPALTLVAVRSSRRRARLRRRYGAEHRHTAQRTGSARRADRDLRAREQRRRGYEVRELAAGERERLRARWEALQASFVDGPRTAVDGADDLLAEVATAKGYDTSEGDALRDVGVDHPVALDRYRASQATGDDEAPDTESLRGALLAARELFETLVGREHATEPGPGSAFRDLIEDTGPVDEDEAVRVAEREYPATAHAAGHGTMPLYGPDGRRLDREAGQTSSASRR